jgi:3-deoxy-D-manno-octulosonic-acid transferase
VFSKLDVWPTLAREAARRGTRLGMVSATLAASSSRRSGLAGSVLREAYAVLDRVGAISTEDADRLVALGVPSRRVSVTGDTRYDQVWARAQRVDRTGVLLAPLGNGRPTVVAGSTWPADEALLLPAWVRVAARVPQARLILCPHEPTPAHVAPLERWAAAAQLRAAYLGASTAPEADVIIVNRIGVLGDLYALADVAYVGGAFHAAGLHSVLEPAAFGVPVLFGPRHEGARDARLLVDADAGLAVDDGAALERALTHWLEAPAERAAAGRAAREVVHAGLGAAERSYALIRDLLG